MDAAIIATSPAAPDGSAHSPLEVLLVDDDSALCRVLELGLGHLGCLVVAVGSIQRAIGCLETFVFDAVICDLRLPDGLGNELIEFVRHRLPRSRLIAISGDDNLLAHSERTRGFDSMLLKPFDLPSLYQAISHGIA